MTIHLTGPLCKCREQDLAWMIRVVDGKMEGMIVKCRKCEIALVVPRAKVAANFSLDTPYPDKGKQEDPDPEKDWN